MAFVLDATIGGASSNSYLTIAEADAYLESNYYASAWFMASTTNTIKDQLLAMATRGLDTLVAWDGLIVASTQKLAWPRTEVVDRDGRSVTSAAIPAFLKDATAEFALSLLSSNRFTDDPVGLGSLKIDVIELDFASSKSSPQTLPDVVQQMVKDYGTILEGNQVGLSR
jgi:hypothetical protein